MPIPQEVLLINGDYIKKYSPISGSVDDNLLYAAAYIAQDKYVEPYLGTDLMAKIKTDLAAGTISGNYSTLLYNYVQKCVCWWTIAEVMHSLTYKVDNGTLVQRTSEDASPVPDSVMKDIKGRAEGNARFYTQELVDYLCHNSSLFPEYNSNTSPDRSPRTDVTGQFNYSFSYGNTSMSRCEGYRKLVDILPYTNV